MSEETKCPHVYKAITNIIHAMSCEGIGKNKKAGSGSFGFNFRGIDDVMNALSPVLAKECLIIFPRVIRHEKIERKNSKGSVLNYVFAHMEYDFVSSVDGSKHTVSVVGEAMDSGDKATNKAMSIALKYAAFQTFFIPTEVTASDADSEIHNVQPLPNLPEIKDKLESTIKSWLKSEKSHEQIINKLQQKYFIDEEAANRVKAVS